MVTTAHFCHPYFRFWKEAKWLSDNFPFLVTSLENNRWEMGRELGVNMKASNLGW